jgi:hypothetical protein
MTAVADLESLMVNNIQNDEAGPGERETERGVGEE